jgi:hypothetical protein
MQYQNVRLICTTAAATIIVVTSAVVAVLCREPVVLFAGIIGACVFAGLSER